MGQKCALIVVRSAKRIKMETTTIHRHTRVGLIVHQTVTAIEPVRVKLGQARAELDAVQNSLPCNGCFHFADEIREVSDSLTTLAQRVESLMERMKRERIALTK